MRGELRCCESCGADTYGRHCSACIEPGVTSIRDMRFTPRRSIKKLRLQRERERLNKEDERRAH